MSNSQLTWKQTIKLGKQEVVRQLRDRGILFDIKTQYFKLCSLLYKAAKAVVNNVVSIVDRQVAKYQKIYDTATDPLTRINAAADKAKTVINSLYF